LQALLDNAECDTALVEFFTLPDRIIIWVLRSGKVKPVVVSVPMLHDHLVRWVEDYRQEIWQYWSHKEAHGTWQELGDPLLREVRQLLPGAGLVHLVPHALLHYLPIHALRVNGRHLIDDFPIAYGPSAAVLARVAQRVSRNNDAYRGQGALVLGYTPRASERKVFEGEAVRVAARFGTSAHVGKKATLALLQRQGGECDTIHLSCHGVFDDENPWASGLHLANGMATVRDIMSLKLKARLVTLSACQTATSARRPGDDLVGLVRAVLYAGASTVLATLWEVEATSALELMDDFYARWAAQGTAKAQGEALALQQAILELRKKMDHPYFWAPFVLVGRATY
jgi:CHAT domain-containing protein